MNKAKQHANYKDHWETPPELFEKLDGIYHFKVDLAANEKNHLCPQWLGPEGLQEDALSTPWDGFDGWCFLNPPYGRGIDKWVAKCVFGGANVVALLPANTDTNWFHDYVQDHAEIVFLRGRVQFLIDGERPRDARGRLTGNTGGSMIAVYGDME